MKLPDRWKTWLTAVLSVVWMVVVCGVCLLCGTCGCSTVVGSRTYIVNGVTNTLAINAKTFLTSADGMQFSTTDAYGFTTTLAMQKAGVDQALTTTTGALLDMAKLVVTIAPFAAKAPTNSVLTNPLPVLSGWTNSLHTP